MSVRKPRFAEAANEADRLLRKHGYLSPPVDPEQIAEEEGIRVVYAEFEGSDNDNFSGFFDLVENAIYVNDDIAPNRITFTIAHELAHHFLHQEYIRSNDYVPMPRRNNYKGPKPVEEIEADTFAANLLVPLHMLARYMKVATISELGRMFSVSDEVIRNRLDLIKRHPNLSKRKS